MKNWLYLLAAVPLILFQSADADASSGYVDFPSYFSSGDSSRVFADFGLSFIDSDYGYLYSSSVGGRMNSRLSGRFNAYYFSVKKDNRVLFGFGDFAFNLTFRAAGDSTASRGIFVRADIRLPSGSRALQPFANRSFDGGGGIELRTALSLFRLKLAGTYIFAGERDPESVYPHSNYLIMAASAGISFGRGSISVSGGRIDYRKSSSRSILKSELSGRIADNMSLVLMAGIEVGEEMERQYDSILSVRLHYGFPPGTSSE